MTRLVSFAIALLTLFVASLVPLPAAADRDHRTPQKDIAKLVEQLGDNDYFVRQRAQSELARLGFEAFDALSAARDHDDIEIAVRARYLLRLMQIRWSFEGDPSQVKRLLESYGTLDGNERNRRIDALANYDDRGAVHALCRIIRFDDSDVRSKRAAQRLIERSPTEASHFSSWSETVIDSLNSSQRAGAKWLRIYVEAREHPDRAADQWGEQLEAEKLAWQQWPGESNHDLLVFLLQQHAKLLTLAGRKDEVTDVLRQMVRLEPGDPDGLADLTQQLSRRRAWGVLDELVERFKARFQSDAVLLYLLSDARRRQGDEAGANRRLAAARAIHPPGRNADGHRQVAQRLQDRGLFDWAEEEYRAAMATQPDEATSRPVIESYWMLAYMLHDLGQHASAAKVIKQMIDLVEQRDKSQRGSTRVFRARWAYFLACAAESDGNRSKQLDYLDQVIEQNGYDVDALIALYHYPQLDAARMQDVKTRIARAIEQFHANIRQAQANSINVRGTLAVEDNQLAWLISNSQGDLDEALESSRRSLEIDPRNAGFMDTLARCYYARKDYQRAVKYQTWACDAEPYSGQMRRQLELFQQTLAQSRKRPAD